MASLCRSAAMAAAKSVGTRSAKILLSKTLSPKSMASTRTASRRAMVLGSMESLMPLHSAIASARLKSIIAVDSSCWSWLSQGLALPL